MHGIDITFIPLIYFALCFALLGLIIGSFIAALCVRWPQGVSIMTGRSACDNCGTILRAHELIPLISHVIARGKCRTCHHAINPLHWQVEIIAAIIGLLPFLIVPTANAAGWAVLGWLLLPLAILDLRHLWLPNRLIIMLVIAAIIIAPLINNLSLFERVIGALVGYTSLALIAFIFQHWKKKEALGAGDPKLFAIIGLYMGWQALPLVIFLASSLGLLWVIILSISGRNIDQDHKLPLGTYMILAIPMAALLSQHF